MNAMTWAPVWEALLLQLVVPLATALILALCTYLLSRLPGPIQAALSSATHKRDMELLLGAMLRAALAYLTRPNTGAPLPRFAVDEVVAYAKSNLPDTIRKLAPSDDTLRTMAEAIVAEAAAKLAPKGPAV
jgi:hypothetical protein